MRACAGPEPGSNLPHGTRRVCRAAARGMQAETPPKQAALARQVRQRMNRLGKPEHRARFCFFAKKKSPAGTRRFPIPSKSKFRWALTAAPSSLTDPKALLLPISLTGAKRHHIRKNHRRTRPLYSPAGPARSANHAPSSHRICCPLRIIAPHGGAAPIARMRRARAGFEHAARCSRSMPRLPPEGCKRKCRPNRRLGAASAAKDEPARQARAPRALLLLF